VRVNLVAVVLAAGGGSRFAGPTHKLLAPLDHRPVVHHAISHAIDSAIGRVIVVTGAIDLELGPMSESVTVVTNEQWQQGQATSIAAATAAAASWDADAIVFGLGDQPFVPPDAWRGVAHASAEHQIVVASYDGRRGPHPVRLHRSLWAALPHVGDDGARTLIREHPALVHEVPCPGSAADIDTLEDLHRWTSS
jgi:molybdenum cofactor cytidylyltransferase